MDFFRSQKKEPGQAEPPPLGMPSSVDPPADLPELVSRLGGLGQMLAQVNDQVLGYLARRDNSGIEEKLDQLARKLDQLPARETKVEAPGAGVVAGPLVLDDTLKNFLQLLRQKLDDLDHNDQQLGEAIFRLQQGADARPKEPVREFVEPAPAPAPKPVKAAAPAPGGNWQQAILGPELTAQPTLEPHRQRLFDGMLSGEPAACALAGQLLLFQSAAPEKMAPLLRDIGEAYYRWQPKCVPGTLPMETALVQWLKRRCEMTGIANQIELVSPGERFDALRHHATARGVEITEVHGWVVLRDNGKVYTKAAVAVK
jgi:hypothetical protein